MLCRGYSYAILIVLLVLSRDAHSEAPLAGPAKTSSDEQTPGQSERTSAHDPSIVLRTIWNSRDELPFHPQRFLGILQSHSGLVEPPLWGQHLGLYFYERKSARGIKLSDAHALNQAAAIYGETGPRVREMQLGGVSVCCVFDAKLSVERPVVTANLGSSDLYAASIDVAKSVFASDTQGCVNIQMKGSEAVSFRPTASGSYPLSDCVACRVGTKCLVCFFEQRGVRFPIVCISQDEMCIDWEAVVIGRDAPNTMYSGQPPSASVEIVTNGHTVGVFGIDWTACSVDCFSILDGKPLLRFTTVPERMSK